MRLIDCYTELLTFTGYFLTDLHLSSSNFPHLSKHYDTLITRSQELADRNGISRETWLGGFFPVCALIDETVLQSDWPDKSRWLQAMLQRKYFNTTNAGEEFFRRLEKIPGGDKELHEVYDYCLTIGFKGRYFAHEDARQLADIRFTNLESVAAESELSFPETIFPDAYGSASGKGKKGRWTRQSGFSFILIAVSVLILIGLYFLLDTSLTSMVSHYFQPDTAAK